jgi:hypothetical protein
MSQQPSQDPEAGAKLLGGVVGLGVLFYLGYMFFAGGIEKEAAETMRTIEQQVARDSVDQYNITKTSGTAIDQCVHAGMVAAAYLQAKDKNSYATWKATEKQDCAAAGVPR